MRFRRYWSAFLLTSSTIVLLPAQQPNAVVTPSPIVAETVAISQPHAVAAQNTYHRILAVVPMTGSGKPDDPKRPMYLPAARPDASDRSGIIAFTHVPSDDGKFAIVEFVAADRGAFKDILADKSIRIFEKEKDLPAAVELILRTYKKNFSLQNFGAIAR